MAIGPDVANVIVPGLPEVVESLPAVAGITVQDGRIRNTQHILTIHIEPAFTIQVWLMVYTSTGVRINAAREI